MKILPLSKGVLVVFAMALGAFLLPSFGHAQTFQTYSGGDGGTWDQGVTPDWNGSTWQGGFDLGFFNTPGTVHISGTVTADYLEFSQAGATTITGGTLEENPWLTWGTDPSPGYETLIQVDGGAGPVTIASQIELSDLGGNEQDYITNSGSAGLTINNIDFGVYTLQPGRTTDRRVNLYSNSAAATITMNGNYTDSAAYGYGALNFLASGAGSTAATASVFNITSNADFSHFTNGQLNNYGGGIFNIDNSTFLASETISATDADTFNEINIIGGHTGNKSILLNLYDSTKNSGTGDGVNPTPGFQNVSDYGVEHVNQSTADVTTWAGGVDQDGSNLNLSAVSGGRLIMSGNLYDHTPLGLVVSGDGVVVLGATGGNTYDEQEGNAYVLNMNPVAADLQSGTTLIENTQGGSAFGQLTTSGNTPGLSPGTGTTSNPSIVKVEGGATLGGKGYITQKVIAEGVVGTTGASIIAPGDPGWSPSVLSVPGQAKINPSMGSLTLSGGLDAENGLTLDFKLNGIQNTGGGDLHTVPGQSNDLINIGSAGMVLNGLVTINLSAMLGNGPLLTGSGNEYDLIQGTGNTGDWTGNPTFDVIAPAGYELDPDFGFNGGYVYDTVGDSFYVELIAAPIEAPEPSIYGLLGLGLLALLAIGRFRWLAA